MEPLGDPLPKHIVYAVSSVRLRGSNIVNESQQRFIPAEDPELKVQLLFFSGVRGARCHLRIPGRLGHPAPSSPTATARSFHWGLARKSPCMRCRGANMR